MSDHKNAYTGRVCGKGGKTLFKSGVHPTRELCAAECFASRPKAKECSTSEVTIRNMGGTEYVLDYGRDIRWHRKA